MGLFAVSNAQAVPEKFCAMPLFNSELRHSILPNAGEYVLLGDELNQRDSHTLELSGNASIRYGNNILRAEQLSFDITNNMASSHSELTFEQEDVQITGHQASINWLANTVAVQNVRYFFPQSSGTGEARAFTIDQADFQLQHATYSTCDPQRLGWRIRASQLNLNYKTHLGSAKHVRIEIGSVPVFYLPYVSFATEGRKSGFLPAQLSNSSSSGLGVSAPFYWNIAANRDATITPRWLSKRGLLLENELRYMNQRNRGQIQVEFLPNDVLRASDRSLYALKHDAQVGKRIDWRVNVAQVSDIYYFRDFGSNLDSVSRSYIDRQLSVRAGGSFWSFSGLAQDFQVLETGIDEPYRRLPQLSLYLEKKYRYFAFSQRSEYSYFNLANNLSAQRLVLLPQVTLPIRRRWMHFEPKVFTHVSQYWGDEGIAGDSSVVPGVSLDSGLVFARTTEANLQLLKPRLYYLYIPPRDQQNLPIFDSRVADFQYSQLFDYQRYVGNDRLGAAHRLTMALDSFWLTSGGVERMSVGVAQTYYVANQQAYFDAEPDVEAGSVQSAGYGSVYLSTDISVAGNILLQNDKIQAEKGDFRLNYSGKSASANLGYRYREILGNQMSASSVIAFAPSWSLSSRLLYSIEELQIQEAYVGVEYNACCWSVRAVASRYINRQGELNSGVAVQLELKGLTSLGSRLEDRFSFTRR